MGYLVRMPKMGMSMDEGVVVEWLVQEGESAEEGDALVIVESEKASNEVEAREDGVLRRIVAPEGSVVEPGDPIGIFAAADEDISRFEAEITDAEPASIEGSGRDQGGSGSGGEPAPSTDEGDVRATPGARRAAAERGIDVAAIEGTGPQGVVTEEDVAAHEDAVETATVASGGATQTVVEARELSGMQRSISERLSESAHEAVHVTLNRSVDIDALRDVLSAAGDQNGDVSITDMLVKAVGHTLAGHPEFNAVYRDGEHRLIEEVNVGVAVDVEGGLVTPVIPTVTEKSVETVSDVRRSLTDRARSGDFDVDDLSGGTFTVSNLGMFGVDHFDPVIDPPQIAILGVGRTRDDGTMTLSVSFDHRVVNGADAAKFLDSLVGTLTDRSVLPSFFEVPPDLGGRPDRDVRVETDSGFAGQYRTAYGDVGFDEPEEVGGTGTAPSPVDHLLGALGSCLSLSVRQLAERDGVEIGRIACDVSGTPATGPLREVHVELGVESDAEDVDIETTVEKAERACYVARSLSDDLPVSIDWERT